MGGRDRARSFSRLTSALYHYEFYDREQAVIQAWERVNNDPTAAANVTAELTGLLDGANYTPVTMAELDDAMTRESLISLRLEVDLDDYDELLIYRRGSHLWRLCMVHRGLAPVAIPCSMICCHWRGIATWQPNLALSVTAPCHWKTW